MFFQLFEGTPLGALIPIGFVAAVLGTGARIVKNLPKESINKFIEHRTFRYQIIARDTKGRVAAVQKQRLVFLSFVIACAAAVSVFLIYSMSNDVQPPAPRSVPAKASSAPAR